MTPRRIVVTGASSGIGHACVVHLAERGCEVFAGARTAAAADTLRAIDPRRIRPLLLDVTDPDAIEAAAATVGDGRLDGLVNSAGTAAMGPLELLSTAELRGQFEVNVLGLMAVTRAFLPALRLGRGRIVNVGSIAGRSALPGTGAYDATKFAIEALTDSLRMELRSSGIAVAVIEPGAVATPIWDKSLASIEALKRATPPQRYRLYETLMSRITEETTRGARAAIPVGSVVRAIEHALTARRPRTRYPVGRDAYFWLLLNLLPDRVRDWLIMELL